MAIKGGQIIHAGNGVTVIDRIQTGGPGQVNIPQEKVYELGNYKSVATVRDVPDLTFPLESWDTSTEIERLFTQHSGAGPIDLATAKPLDIASQFKAGLTEDDPFAVVASVSVPFLNLEQMSYRFGLRDNATQSAQLRGDSIYYNPGPAYVQSVAGTGVAGQEVVLANPAFPIFTGGTTRYAQAVTVGTRRLVPGRDYTEAAGAVANGVAPVTLTVRDAVDVDDEIRVMYSSSTALDYPQTVHEGVVVKPAAVKGRDIEIYVGGYDPADYEASQEFRLASVQSATCEWRVTLDKDEEFGNEYAVGQDFEVPTVNGSLDFKPADPAALLRLLNRLVRNAGGLPAGSLGAELQGVAIPLDIVIKHPDDDSILKRLNVPDARFTLPGFTGRVQQKSTVTVNYESDEARCSSTRTDPTHVQHQAGGPVRETEDSPAPTLTRRCRGVPASP